MTSWGGLCGPAGLPPAMVEKASGLVKKVLESEKIKRIFTEQAAVVFYRDAKGAADFPPRAGGRAGAGDQGVGGEGGLTTTHSILAVLREQCTKTQPMGVTPSRAQEP